MKQWVDRFPGPPGRALEKSMLQTLLYVLAMLAGPAIAPSAQASTDEAWAAFRTNVGAACLAAVADVLEDARADVDPFGSPSFGLAVLRGKVKGGHGSAMVICVYDKQKKSVEIGSAIDVVDD
jgi:hypothetical protein